MNQKKTLKNPQEFIVKHMQFQDNNFVFDASGRIVKTS